MSVGRQIGPFLLRKSLPQPGPFQGQLFEAERQASQPGVEDLLNRQSGYQSGGVSWPADHVVVVELLSTEPDTSWVRGGFSALLTVPTDGGFAVLYPAGSEPALARKVVPEVTYALTLEFRPSGNAIGVYYRFSTRPTRGALVARMVEDPGEIQEFRHEPIRMTQFLASGHLSWLIKANPKHLWLEVALEEPTLVGRRVLCREERLIPTPATIFWRNSPLGIAVWATRSIEEEVELGATLLGGMRRILRVENVPGQGTAPSLLRTLQPVRELEILLEDQRLWLSPKFAGAPGTC